MREFTPHEICDATLIGKWEEITGQPASTITHNSTDTEVLNGLVVYGYETKFGNTNENGEQYAKDAIDKFINSYFVERKLNMPVDIEHCCNPEWLVGRVIYAETNNTGFYFVAYIPKEHPKYGYIKMLIENGLLQGFSKMGWATKGKWVDDEKEQPYGGHYLIEEMEIVRMSIVSTPANGVSFERVKEVHNTMRYENKADKKKTLKDMFK